jgi:phosphoribosyl 1,2-cyclic phosphodiesterase
VIRFASLGSGSTGNATLVEASAGITTTRLLVDCGFSLRELDTRLARMGLGCDDIDAVFVTHEHGDHVGCALGLARRHGAALWTSRGTWQAIDDGDEPPARLHFARDGVAMAVGDLELQPYTVPHDAREPLQLVCSDGAVRLGLLTDAGSLTAHMRSSLARCDALLLECNHDRELLAASSYPLSLKARIAGPRGHLANELSSALLAACAHDRLRHVVAAHLSERNNRPELATAALAAALGGRADDIVVADPLHGFGWLAL